MGVLIPGVPELVATPRLGLAVALALVAAVAFGAAAVFQHRAIRGSADISSSQQSLSVRQIVGLLKIPNWRAGLLFTIFGTLLHVGALAIAPLTIIQPIGVLAVPAAVIMAAGYDRRRISRQVIGGVAVCAVGIVAFVSLATPQAAAGALDARPMLFAAVAVVLVSGVLFLFARWASALGWPVWARCLLLASAGAINFGLASALVRDLSQIIAAGRFGQALLLDLGLVLGLAVGAGLGSYFIQQAYHAGAAPVVTACGTVIDPVVAVLLGITVLAESHPTGAGHITGMIISALVAATGVVILARFHPDSVVVRAGHDAELRRPAAAGDETGDRG